MYELPQWPHDVEDEDDKEQDNIGNGDGDDTAYQEDEIKRNTKSNHLYDKHAWPNEKPLFYLTFRRDHDADDDDDDGDDNDDDDDDDSDDLDDDHHHEHHRGLAS